MSQRSTAFWSSVVPCEVSDHERTKVKKREFHAKSGFAQTTCSPLGSLPSLNEPELSLPKENRNC